VALKKEERVFKGLVKDFLRRECVFNNPFEPLTKLQDSLLQVVDDIGSHLEYFQELEHATRMLNHPGESLLFQPDFHYMVERVNICIEFLKGHVCSAIPPDLRKPTHLDISSQRHYREAEVYLLRFQQCMTRAMTLIKMNFVGSLRALSAEISKRASPIAYAPTFENFAHTKIIIPGYLFNSPTPSPLRTFSYRVRKSSPLVRELERRVSEYPDELGSLLRVSYRILFDTKIPFGSSHNGGDQGSGSCPK
jgi:hypothetical protein